MLDKPTDMQVYGASQQQPTLLTQSGSPYANDRDNIPEERKKLVECIINEVTYARDVFFKDDYKQMVEDMQFAYDGATPEWVSYGGYIANIVQRHLQQKTSTLYAKNPIATAKRKPRMDFEIWDEDMQSVIQAMQILQSGAYDFESIALLQDYQRGMNDRMIANKIAKTLEIVYGYYQNEQNPTFKAEMKQMVRRTITCGVGYVKLGYQRVNGTSPDVARKLYDFDRRIKTLERLIADDQDDNGYTYDRQAEIANTEIVIRELQMEPEMLLREGLVFHFPMSTAIIPDPKCINLLGFRNADWVAEEYHFTADDIKELWKVDVTAGGGTSWISRSEVNDYWMGITDQDGNKIKKTSSEGCAVYRVWEVYNIKTGLVYNVCEGYKDFLEEPHAPDIETDTFWPWLPLVFNPIESEKRLFPHSDVFLMRDQQMEINRQREGLRKHRIANRPKYIAPRGSLEEEDKDRLENHEDSGIIEINNLKIGQNSAEIVQPMKMAGIDPNLYDVSQSYDDMLRVLGSQEVDFGGSSNSTATEASIGASSKMSSVDSNRDDVDMLLSSLARYSGQVLFAELSPETATEIAGRGAVWPTLSRSERSKEIFLDIQAGSSGKPNQALSIANLERLTPLLMQLPGLRATRLAKEAVERLGDNLDINEFIEAGAPSIQALNSMFGKQGSAAMGGAVSAEGTPNSMASQQQQPQAVPIGAQTIPGY